MGSKIDRAAVSHIMLQDLYDGWSAITSEPQTLTESQKAQARENIGVEESNIYETVNIILSSDDESGVEIGAEVTVAYADVTETKEYETGGIQFKIPTSLEYTIGFETIVGYATPVAVTRTAIAGNQITINKEYVEAAFDVVTLDQSITDAATMLDGDINGPVLQWIRVNSHRYLGKQTASGEVTLCQLDDNDSTKYADGTDADLTGAEGDVFMKLPVFWWKSETVGDLTTIALSKKSVEGFKKWEGDKEIIGVYEAYSASNKLYSRSGVNSFGSSQSNFKTQSRARGNGYTIVTWEWNCIMALLYYCQYGNMNCQVLIGAGTNDFQKTTGQTNSLGMKDTEASVEGNTQSINFWGLENWWGNKWEWIDNVVVNATEVDHLWRIADHEGNERTVQGLQSSASESYIKSCALGSNFDLVPKVGGGSNTTGYCDAHWYIPSVGRVVVRSGGYAYLRGGVAHSYADNDASFSNADCGSRLAFHGNVSIEGDVSAYKALTPIG